MVDFDAQTEPERVHNLPAFCVKFGLANPNIDLIVEIDDESDEIQNITMSQTVHDEPDVPICDLEPEPTFAVL